MTRTMHDEDRCMEFYNTARVVRDDKGQPQIVLLDLLQQLMPQSNKHDLRMHLLAFQKQAGLPPFAKVYLPTPGIPNPRKVAYNQVAAPLCAAELICSVPGDAEHMIGAANNLLMHFGTAAPSLVHKPLAKQEQLPTTTLRPQPWQTVTIEESRQELCKSVVESLTKTALSKTLLQFNATLINVHKDCEDQPWFRGLAVAEALGYADPKKALQNHVKRPRKKKREQLPMPTDLPKREREAWWVDVAGVQQLVDKCQDRLLGGVFRDWLLTEALPTTYETAQASDAVQASEPEDAHSSTTQTLERTLLEAKIANEMRWQMIDKASYEKELLTLAQEAQRASDELGVPLTPEQREQLIRQAFEPQPLMPTPEVAPNDDELTRQIYGSHRQSVAIDRIHKKIAGLDLARARRKAAAEWGLGVSKTQLLAERLALEVAAHPIGLDEDGWLLAGDYLILRGHSDDEIIKLQTSFGRMLKALYMEQRGEKPETVLRDYNSQLDCATCRYHCREDRHILNAAYQKFLTTELYRSTVPSAVQALNALGP